MKFHPGISISLGLIASFILYFIAVLGFSASAGIWAAFTVHSGASWLGTFVLFFSYMLGGFIATYLARENKIKYGLYEGLAFILIFFLWSEPIWYLEYNNAIILASTIFANCMIPLYALTGGILGQMMDKSYKKLNPILAIIAGSIIGYSCVELSFLITGHHPYAIYDINVIGIVVGVISFLIGGFVAMFLAKEKKIKYGIYTGIFIIVIGLIQMLMFRTIHIPLPMYLIYVLSAVIGGYLAIMASKHLTHNQKCS